MEQKPPDTTPDTAAVLRAVDARLRDVSSILPKTASPSAPLTAGATESKRPASRLSEGGSGDLLREWGLDPATIKPRPNKPEIAMDDGPGRDPKPGSGRELLMSIDRRTAENREHGRGRELRPPWLDPRYG